MTICYLIVTAVALGIAALGVFGTGFTGSVPFIWTGRALPVVAALIACVAFCQVAIRARLGVLAPIYFCIPLLALSSLVILPHVMTVRNSNVFTMLNVIAPILTLFPALALWHLATAGKRGRAR